jgi:hypothetical protein
MTISGSGNVGIGTNSPINKLTISNDGNSVVAFRINDTNANASYIALNASNTDAGIIANGTTAIPLDIYTGGSPRMRITSLGCVGIGTTAPQTTLHVLNCTDGVVGGNYIGQLIVERNGEAAINIKGLTYSSIYFGDVANAVEGAIVYNHSTNNLELRGSGNVADLTIASTGNIGINTTNFGERLNIGCGGAMGFQNTCNCQKWHIQYNTNDGLNFVESAVADFRLFLKAGGSVGIGTNNPSAYGFLGVVGTSTINTLTGVVAGFSDNVAGTTRLYIQSGVNGISVDQDFAVSTGGGIPVERMRINTSGIITMPQQPSMFAQPGAGAFPIGHNQTAYGWCTSGSVRYNSGFTLTAATSAACNIADAQNTGKIIIPATGKYLLQFSQRNEAQCTSDGQFFLWVNGTTRIRRHIELWSTTRYIHVDVTAILPLNTGDCLEMGAWFNGNGKTDTFAGTNDTVNWMSLAKIS